MKHPAAGGASPDVQRPVQARACAVEGTAVLQGLQPAGEKGNLRAAGGKGDNVRPEHLKEFAERWPTWFDFNGDITRTAMPNGFYGIGGGWRRVLWNLCVELEPHVEALNRKLATQDPARSFEVLPDPQSPA